MGECLAFMMMVDGLNDTVWANKKKKITFTGQGVPYVSRVMDTTKFGLDGACSCCATLC